MDAVASSGGAVCSTLARFAFFAPVTTTLSFSSLPHAVALHVFAFVPADARARAALVCRAWRDAIAEPSVWARLDLSPASGVTVAVTDAVLRGAAARAQGQLAAILLKPRLFSRAALLDVVAANGGSLRELNCVFATSLRDEPYHLDIEEVENLARAAPQLRLLYAVVMTSVASVARLLRNDPPFVSLRLHDLEIDGDNVDDPTATVVADVLAFAAALPGHASLRELGCYRVLPLHEPVVLDALAAAVTASTLRNLCFTECNLSPASVPALARMLGGGTLTTLEIDGGRAPLLDAPAAVQFADAIAAHLTLLQLSLHSVGFWHDALAAAAVMRAVTGHPSLQKFELFYDDPPDPTAAGAALGALVAADAPALHKLSIYAELGDAGLRPLIDALAHNTHLWLLDCWNTGMSDEFARESLLPAVRANTSLRTLDLSRHWGDERGYNPLFDRVPSALLEAEALLAARGDGSAA